MRKLLKYADLWLVFALFGTILLLILPVPPFLLDLLLTVSISLSLLTLLVILYLRQPAEFTAFPTLLLFITLYRLALNVASTRLILLDGYAGKYDRVEVSREDAQLVVSLGGAMFLMFAESPTKFFAKTTDVQLEFPGDGQGKPDRVIWSVGEGANEAKRDK